MKHDTKPRHGTICETHSRRTFVVLEGEANHLVEPTHQCQLTEHAQMCVSKQWPRGELMNQIDRQTRVSTRDVMIVVTYSGYPDSRVNVLQVAHRKCILLLLPFSQELPRHPYQVESLITSELMHVSSRFILGRHITTSSHFLKLQPVQ